MHHLPKFLLKMGVAATIWLEGPLTWLLLCPLRGPRIVGASLQIALQVSAPCSNKARDAMGESRAWVDRRCQANTRTYWPAECRTPLQTPHNLLPRWMGVAFAVIEGCHVTSMISRDSFPPPSPLALYP